MAEDFGNDPVRTPESRPKTFDDNHSSAFKFYSMGIAANNKTVGQDLLYVTPIETVSLQDGELVSNPFDQKAEGWDMEDNLYQTKVITDTALKAKWIHSNNRRTSPDVRRGERVNIYRFADRDEFLWESLAQDEHLRKLETVVFSISGTKDEKVDGTLPENSYFVEFSTHKGLITLSTSKKNEEFTTYAFQFNTMDGFVTLSDALGNNVHINSVDTLVELENADGTYVRLDKQDIKMYAPGNIEAKADQDIAIEAGGDVRVKAGGEISHRAGGDIIMAASGKFRVTGESEFSGKIDANGIESSAPIKGPSDTI